MMVVRAAEYFSPELASEEAKKSVEEERDSK